MKKILMISLSAILLLSGCGQSSAAGTSDTEQEDTAKEENTEVIALDGEEGESELETFAVQRKPASEEFRSGAYISVNSSLSPYEPVLMLYGDGTFEFVENCYAGLKIFSGTVSESNGNIVCNVKEQDHPGFADKNEIPFTVVSDYLLRIETDISASATGDLFVYVNQLNSAGTYYNTAEKSFVEGFEPVVVFNEDGSFEMTENLLAGMGKYTGVYLFDGNQYRCKVESVSFSGFAGDNVKVIEFRTDGKGGLLLATDLCGSRNGHAFAPDPEHKVPEAYIPEANIHGGSSEKKGTVFIVAGADSNRIKVRKGPGLTAADTGERKYSGEKVTVYEEVSKDGYTWYRIGTDRWMAGNGTSFGIKFE